MTATWIAALATYGDNYTNIAWPVYPTTYPSDAALLLDLGLNYFMGRGTMVGLSSINSGRGYGFEYMMAGSWLFDMMNASMVFPEANFNANPDLAANANWQMGMIPPGFEAAHEQWGDCRYGGSSAMTSVSTGRDYACFTGNPAVSQYFQSLTQIYGVPGANVYYNELVPTFYFPMPSPQPAATLSTGRPGPMAACLGSSSPANTVNCFSNGVGFGFLWRGRWVLRAASPIWSLTTSTFEIYAYGA